MVLTCPELGGPCSWPEGLEQGPEAVGTWYGEEGECQIQNSLQDTGMRNALHRTVLQQDPIWAKREGKEQVVCICLKVHQCQPVWEKISKVATTAEEMETPFSLNSLFYSLQFFCHVYVLYFSGIYIKITKM